MSQSDAERARDEAFRIARWHLDELHRERLKPLQERQAEEREARLNQERERLRKSPAPVLAPNGARAPLQAEDLERMARQAVAEHEGKARAPFVAMHDEATKHLDDMKRLGAGQDLTPLQIAAAALPELRRAELEPQRQMKPTRDLNALADKPKGLDSPRVKFEDRVIQEPSPAQPGRPKTPEQQYRYDQVLKELQEREREKVRERERERGTRSL